MPLLLLHANVRLVDGCAVRASPLSQALPYQCFLPFNVSTISSPVQQLQHVGSWCCLQQFGLVVVRPECGAAASWSGMLPVVPHNPCLDTLQGQLQWQCMQVICILAQHCTFLVCADSLIHTSLYLFFLRLSSVLTPTT
jgi:hypothetical protein